MFVGILFTIIWIITPISYDERRCQHPNTIFPQETAVVVNNSSFLNKSDQLAFLEGITKDVILVNNNGGSWMLTPPFGPRPGTKTTTGTKGASNPGGGTGGSSISSPSPVQSPSTQPLHFSQQVSNNPKKKQDKRSSKLKDLGDQLVLRLKYNGMPFFVDEMILSKKIYHAPDFGDRVTF